MSDLIITGTMTENENNRCMTYGDLMKPFEKLAKDLGVGLENIANDFSNFCSNDDSDMTDLDNALNKVVSPKRLYFDKNVGVKDNEDYFFWGLREEETEEEGEWDKFCLQLYNNYHPQDYDFIEPLLYNYTGSLGFSFPIDTLNSIEESTGIACPKKMQLTPIIEEIRAFTLLHLKFNLNSVFPDSLQQKGYYLQFLLYANDANFSDSVDIPLSGGSGLPLYDLKCGALMPYDYLPLIFEIYLLNEDYDGTLDFGSSNLTIDCGNDNRCYGDIYSSVDMIYGSLFISKDLAPSFSSDITIGANIGIRELSEIFISYTWDKRDSLVDGVYFYGDKFTTMDTLSDVYWVNDGASVVNEGSVQGDEMKIPISSLQNYNSYNIYIPMNYKYDDLETPETIYLCAGIGNDFNIFVEYQDTTLTFENAIVNMDGVITLNGPRDVVIYNSLGATVTVTDEPTDIPIILTNIIDIGGNLYSEVETFVDLTIYFNDGTFKKLETMSDNNGYFSFGGITLSDANNRVRSVDYIKISA